MGRPGEGREGPMGQTIYLTGSEPLVQAIARAAYPSYQGRKFKLRTTDGPINVRSYWDGGSRDYYVFVRLSDMHATGEVPAQSAYDRRIVGAEAVPLPPGVVCVQHSIRSEERRVGTERRALLV